MESTFLIKAAQLIAAFGLLIIVHEFGHYIFARMFGIRVEKFYLFLIRGSLFSSGNRRRKQAPTMASRRGATRSTA